jgi:hypothetical protein
MVTLQGPQVILTIGSVAFISSINVSSASVAMTTAIPSYFNQIIYSLGEQYSNGFVHSKYSKQLAGL